jgi:hypothetical protein
MREGDDKSRLTGQERALVLMKPFPVPVLQLGIYERNLYKKTRR